MKKILLFCFVFAALFAVAAEKNEAVKAETAKVKKAHAGKAEKAKKSKAVNAPTKEITYLCSFDNTQQPALILEAKSKEPRPLFVTLHTWSANYKQCRSSYAGHLVKHDVYMIAPNFRGKNTVGNKLSMGSDAAISDILDAVKYMQKNYNIDNNRIYLIVQSQIIRASIPALYGGNDPLHKLKAASVLRLCHTPSLFVCNRA